MVKYCIVTIPFFGMFRRASRSSDKAGLRPANQHIPHAQHHRIQPFDFPPFYLACQKYFLLWLMFFTNNSKNQTYRTYSHTSWFDFHTTL